MKKTVVMVVCAGLIGFSAGVALADGDAKDKAQDKGHRRGDAMERFQKADTNKDGKLSLDEFKAMSKKSDADAEKAFKEADTDNDGFLTPAELKAYHQKKMGLKAEKTKPADDKE